MDTSYHPKSTVYIGLTLGAIHSMGLNPVHFFFISKFVLCVLEFSFDSFYILYFSAEIFHLHIHLTIFSILALGYSYNSFSTVLVFKFQYVGHPSRVSINRFFFLPDCGSHLPLDG